MQQAHWPLRACGVQEVGVGEREGRSASYLSSWLVSVSLPNPQLAMQNSIFFALIHTPGRDLLGLLMPLAAVWAWPMEGTRMRWRMGVERDWAISPCHDVVAWGWLPPSMAAALWGSPSSMAPLGP